MKIKFLFRISKRLKIIPKGFEGQKTGDYINETLKIRVLKYSIGEKEFFMATNLLDQNKFTLETLKGYYHERWNIEEYYKFCKKNLSLDYIQSKSSEEIDKNIWCNLIISQLIYMFQKIFISEKTKGKNKILNKTVLVNGFFDSDFLIHHKLQKNFSLYNKIL